MRGRYSGNKLLDPETDPRAIIHTFGMRPHPEGGWYVEAHRAPAADGARPAISTIYFLLRQGERSHWHTVDAIEIWLWQAGAAVRLHLGASGAEAPTKSVLVGPDIERGQSLQSAVPEGVWQSAESTGVWSLVSCVVAPAFHFAGFTIAAPGWSPGTSE